MPLARLFFVTDVTKTPETKLASRIQRGLDPLEVNSVYEALDDVRKKLMLLAEALGTDTI